MLCSDVKYLDVCFKSVVANCTGLFCYDKYEISPYYLFNLIVLIVIFLSVTLPLQLTGPRIYELARFKLHGL